MNDGLMSEPRNVRKRMDADRDRDQRAHGRDEERNAVVKYLRNTARTCAPHSTKRITILNIADDIEQGRHV